MARLRGIEGVRAVAALAVLVYHVWLYSAPGGASVSLGRLGDVVGSNLFVGVTLFFVLSGFLLYKPYATSVIAGKAPPAWRRYLRNRALRILPAYWAILVVVALLLEPELATRPLQLLANLAFLQDYVPGYMPAYNGGLGIVPAWSLANEVVFYLLLPLLGAWALALRRRRMRPVVAALAPVLLLLAVGIVATLAVGPSPDGFHRVWRAGFLPHASWFGVGMGLAVVRVLHEQGRLAVRRWPLLAVTACALLALPAFRLYQRGWLDQLEYEQVLALCCGLLLSVVVLSGDRSRTVAVLGSRPLTAVGLASYSLFLWHDPLLRTLRDAGLTRSGGAGAFLFNLLLIGAISGAAAAATYLAVEKPALARKRPWQAHAPARAERQPTVREVLAACVTRLGAPRSTVELTAPESLSLRVDEAVLDGIAGELLANALAYGAPPIEIAATGDPRRLRLSVRDHGRGVEPAFVPQLFEPFTRSRVSSRQRHEGRGLGLARVRTRVEELGGRVFYAGSEAGALFVVDLPSGPARAAGGRPAPVGGPPRLRAGIAPTAG